VGEGAVVVGDSIWDMLAAGGTMPRSGRRSFERRLRAGWVETSRRVSRLRGSGWSAARHRRSRRSVLKIEHDALYGIICGGQPLQFLW